MERHKDEPFAILGINTDGDKDEFRAKCEEFDVTWRSSWQGSTNGPIPREWRIRGYPSVFVLDAEGRIRFKDVRGKRLDEVVEELLAEMRAAEEAEGEGPGE